MNRIDASLELLRAGAPTIEEFERKIDTLVMALLDSGDLVDEDLTHTFCDGMYIREIKFPAGIVGVSLTHKTESPFVITKGRALVFSPKGGVVELAAGDTGITEKGTRRVVLVLEDISWVGYFRCENGETVEQIEARVFEDMPLPNGNSVRKEWKSRIEKQLEAGNGRSDGSGGGNWCSRGGIFCEQGIVSVEEGV